MGNGRHEIICCGARVIIEGDKVEVLTKPLVKSCPLHGKGKPIDSASVRLDIETAVGKSGFFAKNRIFDPSHVVPFGASEIISICMQMGLLDCSVTVCDGAGTIITDSPSLTQEIGARMSGVVETSPVRGIIEYIRNSHGIVLNEEVAEINQSAGIERASSFGCKKIAVTVAGFEAKTIEAIRDFEEANNIEVSIFSVCNTSVDESNIRFLSMADSVWGCASKIVREIIGPRALMQIGIGIPVFILTQRGKELALAYLQDFDGKLVVFRQNRMPYLVKEREPSLKEED